MRGFNPNAGGVGIIGVGGYVPDTVLKSADVEARAGLAAGDIEKKVGVRERRIVGDDETASGMSAASARQALGRAGIESAELDLILSCSFTPDYLMPAMATKIHQLLGAKRASAFDLVANCTAFQVGLSVASDRLRCDPSLNRALVVGTAINSRYIDWSEQSASMYFGDGSGAAVLGRVPGGYGLLATDVFTNSSAYEAVRIRGGGSSHRHRPNDGVSPYIELRGMDVWKQAAQHQPVAVKNALEKAGLAVADVDCFVFHQANLHLITYLMGKMKVPVEKTHTNVERYGNTAEASMALALTEAVELGKIKHDDIVVISGVGAGFTFGATVMRWYSPR